MKLEEKSFFNLLNQVLNLKIDEKMKPILTKMFRLSEKILKYEDNIHIFKPDIIHLHRRLNRFQESFYGLLDQFYDLQGIKQDLKEKRSFH